MASSWRAAIESGAAKAKLQALIKLSGELASNKDTDMSDILDKIVAVKREEVAAASSANHWPWCGPMPNRGC
jgi:hypothetical protein